MNTSNSISLNLTQVLAAHRVQHNRTVGINGLPLTQHNEITLGARKYLIKGSRFEQNQICGLTKIHASGLSEPHKICWSAGND